MKPIPENRRWQEERANHPEDLPQSPDEETLMIWGSHLLVIPARYTSICPACGRTIQPGMPITRHAIAPTWVHQECQSAPVAQRGIPARYQGFCQVCQRAIQVGELIARDAQWGWVHQECVRNHLVQVDRRMTLDEIINLLRQMHILMDSPNAGEGDEASDG